MQTLIRRAFWLPGAVERIVTKAADETVNNSSVLQDDDELRFPVEADSVYFFLATLRYSTNTTADINLGWTGPAGATMEWGRGHVGTGSSADGFVSAGTGGGGAHSGIGDAISFAGAAESLMMMPGGFLLTDAAAGEIVLRWAQNTANVSDTKVLRGSFISYRRLL